ncbi:MAG: hypothetical protein AB1567_08095 [bacterium]
MQKNFYIHQKEKGFSLIAVLIIVTCLLILGLGLVGLFNYEMRFLYRLLSKEAIEDVGL